MGPRQILHNSCVNNFEYNLIILAKIYFQIDFISNEMKQLMSALRKRLSVLDAIKIISRDLVVNFNQHVFNVRKCSM